MKDPKKTRSKWLISNRLWKEIEPLIPKVKNRHRFGGGRPRVSDKKAMEGIFFVLRTGCQWKALDVTGICSASAAHRRFQDWAKQGVFEEFWKKGLRKYDEAKGIDWRWLSLDTSLHKAPIAGSKKQVKTRRIEANKERNAVS
jgi:transposase